MSVRKLILTALLMGLGSSYHVTLPARAETARPAVSADFQKQFNAQMEAHLRQTLGRSPINFSLEVKPKAAACQGCSSYHLGLPSHLQRDTLFDVTLDHDGSAPVLKGRVYSLREKELLVKSVTAEMGQPKLVSIETFPFSNVGKDYAITRSQADLYVKPQAVAGENLATQARLGTPVRLLQYSPDGKFALARIEDDGYIAWIQRKDLIEGEQTWYQDWLSKRQVLLMKSVNKPVALPVGTRLKLVHQSGATVSAVLPDGKPVQLSKADVVINQPGKLPAADVLLKTARYYLPKGPQGGGSYLWGGTYGTRLDCSGFVQTVYRLNGVYLPRDADQQKGFTQRVADKLAQVAELKAGDLVFFSGNGNYPTHVGMYIGNHQVIHSSPKGPYSGVKINTLVGGGDYDLYLQKIYFGGGRVTRSL